MKKNSIYTIISLHFSTGEARPLRGTSRREVGHGNLAQRALKNMIPADCPYTIRIVSEVLESNGSSSMATFVLELLALMDAGVQMIQNQFLELRWD